MDLLKSRGENMRKKKILLAGILLTLAMLFAACGKEEDIPNQEIEKQEEVANEPVEEPSEEPSLELENAVPEEGDVIVEEEPQYNNSQDSSTNTQFYNLVNVGFDCIGRVGLNY